MICFFHDIIYGVNKAKIVSCREDIKNEVITICGSLKFQKEMMIVAENWL